MTKRGQARQAFPGLRVFIFGQEVTSDVTACTVTWTDARAPNTCDIELVNKDDRYIVGPADIKALYPDTDIEGTFFAELKKPYNHDSWSAAPAEVQLDYSDELDRPFLRERSSETSKRVRDAAVRTIDQNPTERLLRSQRTRIARVSNQDPIKKAVMLAKLTPDTIQDVVQPDLTDTLVDEAARTKNIKGYLALTGKAFRYPYQCGDCIFHSNDAIRIFFRDPYQPQVWYHMFAGFVSDWTDAVDANDARVVRIRGEDVSRILRYARVSTNPGIFDIEALRTNRDLAIRTAFSKPYANLSLMEILFTILFGPDMAETRSKLQAFNESQPEKDLSYAHKGVNGVEFTSVSPLGAGAFRFDDSVLMRLGPKSEQESPRDMPAALAGHIVGTDSLATWQALVDHQVHVSDLKDLALNRSIIAFEKADAYPVSAFTRSTSDPLNPKITIAEVITELGSHPEKYPVGGGRLLMLAPASLGPETTNLFVEKDIIDSIPGTTTWSTRLGIIYDLMERIDYSFYASPKGDLICEMPLYDFDPHHFGNEKVPSKLFDLDRLLPTPDFGYTLVNLLPTEQAELDLTTGRGALGVGDYIRRFAALKGAKSLVESEDRGPYAPHLIFRSGDMISWERTFSDERVRTQFVVPKATLMQLLSTGNSTDTLGQPPGVYTAFPLVAAFGVRAEQSDLLGFISSPQAARIYAEMRLHKINADARSAAVEVLPRLGVGVNRPVEFEDRQFIGTVRQVTHTIRWGSGGEQTMSLDVNHLRGWSGQVDESGNPFYEPIGGFASRTLNYALRLQLTDPESSTKS